MSPTADPTHTPPTLAQGRLYKAPATECCTAHGAVSNLQRSPESQTILDEIDCELKDTRERLVSALYLPEAETGTSLMDEIRKEVTMTDEKPSLARRPISCDDKSSESLTNVSSYDGDTVVNSAAVTGATSAKALVTPANRLNHVTSKMSRVASLAMTKRSSLFPVSRTTSAEAQPGSPQTSLSPLGNGRDAYGNYIATNANDYFLTQSPTASPLLKSVNTDLITADGGCRPRLRGGGGFWNNLGLGPVGSGKSVNEGMSRQTTPIQVDPISHPLSCSNIGNNGVAASRPRESIPISPGTKPLTQINSNYGRTNVPVRGGPRQQHLQNVFQEDMTVGGAPVSPTIGSATTKPLAVPQLPNYPDAETTISSFSRHGRSEKKWANETASGPPMEQDLPPPPSLSPRTYRFSGKSVPGAGNRANEHRTINDLSNPVIAGDHRSHPSASVIGHDFMSLQLGESVSTAGYALREAYDKEHYLYQKPQPIARQPDFDPTPEEINAWQEHAQSEFRKRMQGIMARYNANKSSIQRALHLDQITQELHDNQADFYNKTVERELKEAADETGYAILEDPIAITEAIKTRDGYHIYHDMLEPIQPELWHQIDNQHQQHMQSAHQDSYRKHKSTWEQGVHVAGKIARFLLAAPSDPELKSFSNRLPPRLSSLTPDVGAAVAAKPALMKNKGKGRAGDSEVAAGEFARRSPRIRDLSYPRRDSSEPGLSRHFRPITPRAPSQQSRLYPERPNDDTKPTDKPGNMGLYPPYRLERPNSMETGGSAMSGWPEGDSQGNWTVPRQPIMRGGNGKVKGISGKGGRTSKRIKDFILGKQPYVDYSAAMRMH